ncbi:MBOAT family protein [bacterium]|nr:MBOAT family protein [bacterium]
MSFNSLAFLIFLPIVVALYYILPHKARWIMLLIASYIFYTYWNFSLIFLILTTTLVSYLAGILIEKTDKKGLKKLYLIVAISICLGILVFFKYFNFLSHSVTALIRLFNGDVVDFTLDLILPVGISFYTFQTLSYVIDVYREKIEAEKHLGYFALFVSFFPQLVAGPIERPEVLLPQLKEEHKLDKSNLLVGFRIITGGFIKKVVIADTLAVYVDRVFNSGDMNGVTGLAAFVGIVLFLLQIYCDFSAYSNIATGCAKMLGIDLSVNFKDPLLSESVSNVWSRWHITLNSWFTDYVYTPLNARSMGKKHIKLRIYINLFIVFMLSGLWHGANWTFFLWGVFNGTVMVISEVIKKPKKNFMKKHGLKERNPKTKWLRILFTNLIMALSLVFFRARNVSEAFMLYGKIFSDYSFSLDYLRTTVELLDLNVINAAIILLLSVLIFKVDKYIITPKGYDIITLEQDRTINLYYAYLIWLILIGWVLLLSLGQSHGFIYFQF